MRRSFVTLVAATALLFASASASLGVKLATSDDATEVAAAGPGAAAGRPAAAEPPSVDDKVTLLDAGAGPLRLLRARPVVGSTVRTAMEARLSLDMEIDGEPVTSGTAPGFRMVLTQRVDDVGPDGTAEFTMTYTEVRAVGGPGIDPDVVDDVDAALEDLEGLTGTGTVDARGQVQSVSLGTEQVSDPVAKSMLDSMSSQVSNLSAPFPLEPVGVGARWTVKADATILGITMGTTATYTLTAREGDAYELAVVSTATAEPQPFEFPDMPAGAEARVTRFEVRTTGTAAGDEASLLPRRSKLTAEGDVVIRITEDGETGRVVQRLEMDLTVEPAGAPVESRRRQAGSLRS